MLPRLAPALAAAIVAFTAAACAASAGDTATATPVPSATPVLIPIVSPGATSAPDEGNVDGVVYPELTIEQVDATTIQATIKDPVAKAWRLVVAGVGPHASDRLELEVETGDVGPSILAREVRDGQVVDEMDLSAYADGTAAAGGCHRTLPVCVESTGFRLPSDGNGTFSVRLTLTDTGMPLALTGGTATWPAEPFVLGPWTDTEAFPWSQG